MKDLNILNKEVETMSSLEIAELTGKTHRNVTRDIREVLNEAEIDALKFEHTYKDKSNRQQKCYNLPRRECDIVISGYSVKYRMAIIDRWHELEVEKVSWEKSSPLSKSYDDFLRELKAACKDDPEMIKCFAHLGSKAMSNARRAKKWYREQFLPHFRVILGIAEPGDTVMLGYTDDPTTLEQVSYKFTRQWPDLLYLSCSSQNDLFAV